MPKTLMLLLALLVSTAWLAAQDQYPQAGSKQAGSAASDQTTVQGCLQGTSGSFTLTSDSGATYQLQGDTSKLSKHIGHEVQVTGSPSGAGSSSSAGAGSSSSATGPNAGTSAGGSQQTLTVHNLKHISKTCTSTSK